MHLPLSRRSFLGVLFMASCLVGPAWAAPRGGAPAPAKPKGVTPKGVRPNAGKAKKPVEKLVSSSLEEFKMQDKLKMNWDPNNKGEIGDGTSDCFDTAMTLSVNGKNWSLVGEIKKTKPGGEMVIHGTSSAAPVKLRRRMMFDKKKALLRYVDSFTNTSRARIDLSVSYRSTLGSSARNTISNTGRVAMSGPLGKDESGIVAFRTRENRPSVLFHLCSVGAGNRPNISVEGSHRHYNFLFNLKLPPGKTRAVCVTIAQRHFDSQPTAEQVTAQLKPLQEAATKALKLESIVGSIENLHGGRTFGGEVSISEGTLVELEGLLKVRGIDRVDNADTLILDDGQQLGGTVTASPFVVSSRLGTITISEKDVAGIVGGRGEGNPTRLLLRNGEIITGDVKPEGPLTIKTGSGLVIPVRVDSMELLVFRYDEADGARLKKGEVYVRLLDGSKCLAHTNEDQKISGIAPWGEFSIAPADVVHLGHTFEPYPSYWIVDKHGSKFPAAVSAGKSPFIPTRYPDAELSISDVSALYRTLTAEKDSSAEEAEPKKDDANADKEAPALKVKSRLELVGGARVVGKVTCEFLKISNGKRTRDIPVAIVHELGRDKKARESAGLAIQWVSTSGEKSPGVLRTQVVPVQTAYGVWNVPASHIQRAVVNARLPEKVEEDKEAAADTKEGDAEGGPANDATKKAAKAPGTSSKPKAPSASPPPPVAPTTPVVPPSTPNTPKAP